MNKPQYFGIFLTFLLTLPSFSNPAQAQFDPFITQPQLPPTINAPALEIQRQVCLDNNMANDPRCQPYYKPSPRRNNPSNEFTRQEIRQIADKIRKMSASDASGALNVNLISVICQDSSPKINGRRLNANETAMLHEELGCQASSVPNSSSSSDRNNNALEAYLYRGFTYVTLQDFQSALRDANQLIQLDPERVKQWDKEDLFDNYIIAAHR